MIRVKVRIELFCNIWLVAALLWVERNESIEIILEILVKMKNQVFDDVCLTTAVLYRE
jgi:hypothetical protein